ncbi:MAG: START domain-containing protein [Pseudomonadota bacterium]
MERKIVPLVIAVLLLLTTNQAAAWTLVKEQDGIQVQTRKLEDSAIAESLATVTVESGLAPIVALILDADNQYRWIDSVDHSERVEQISTTTSCNYTLSKAPWPVADRDAVVLTEASQDPATHVVQIRSHAVPERLPEKKGVVRIMRVDSLWTLTPQPGGKVEISYRVHSEPGGQLPAWLINSVITDQPFNTLSKLRDIIGTAPYKDSRVSFIREPEMR